MRPLIYVHMYSMNEYALREKQKYGTIPCKNPIFKLTI